MTIVLVITKVDLLLRDTDMNCIGDWVVEATVKKKLNVLSIHLTSSKSLVGITRVISKIQQEKKKFVVEVVSLAISRDGASGGVVRTIAINTDGVKTNFYPGDKLPLWHEELEPQNSLLDILTAGNTDPMIQ